MPPTTPDDHLLTTTEAAAYLRLAPKTLERFRITAGGPPFLKAGPGKRARVLYRRSDLDAWLAKFSYGSTSEYPRGVAETSQK